MPGALCAGGGSEPGSGAGVRRERLRSAAGLPAGAARDGDEGTLRLKPEIETTKRLEGGIITFTTGSADRHVKRVEYRLHAGKLYEVAIHYRLDRLPDGVAGLLAQLKEFYGQPALDREEHFDREHGDISRWGTVLEDAQTRMTLLERQYLPEATLLTALVLTVTDLELARRYEAAQEERVRRKWNKVPIPMPEPSPPRRSRSTSSARSSVRQEAGW